MKSEPGHRAAMGSYAESHSAALLLFPRPCQIDVGSSTCVRIEERYFLATAGHNIEDLGHDSQIRVVAPGTEDEPLPFVGRNCLRFQGSATVDVAWIELHPESAQQSGLSFLGLSQLSRRRAYEQQESFFVQGFPSEMAAVGDDLTTDIEPSPLGFLTRPIDPSSRGSRHQPGVDLAVEYASRSHQPPAAELPRAAGMSGGGMWRVASDGARLVAITRTWYSRSQELCGTSIEHWLQLVYVDFPELRSRLDPVLTL